MAPPFYKPYNYAKVELRRRELLAMGYRLASPPWQNATPNVPLFKHHDRYYYRPHYHMVLAIVASIQVAYEEFIRWRDDPRSEKVLAERPPPDSRKVALLKLVHGAPKSWWRKLDPLMGHIMLLQQTSVADPKGNMLLDWLLAYTGV